MESSSLGFILSFLCGCLRDSSTLLGGIVDPRTVRRVSVPGPRPSRDTFLELSSIHYLICEPVGQGRRFLLKFVIIRIVGCVLCYVAEGDIKSD